MSLRLEYLISREYKEGSLTVEMAYIPTLSVNRYKTARGITRFEVKKWMSELSWITGLTTERGIKPPIKVTVSGVFKDKRHPDMDNLLKVICDAVKFGLGIDDKDYTHETLPATIGGEPRLIITIEQLQEVL